MWGEGLDLILELDEGSLKLLESDTGRVLNSQPIHAIRFADILYSSNFKGIESLPQIIFCNLMA